MRVRFVPEADEELSEATAYLNERSKQAAQRFLADVDRAIQLLLQFPRLGSPLVHDLRGSRVKSSAFMPSPMFEGGGDTGESAFRPYHDK